MKQKARQSFEMLVPRLSGIPAGDGWGPPAEGNEAMTAPPLLKDCACRGLSICFLVCLSAWKTLGAGKL